MAGVALGDMDVAFLSFSRPKSPKKRFLNVVFELFAPEKFKKYVFEKFGQAPFLRGDSRRCTFLKTVVFELFAPEKSKKDVFEKPSQARFPQGPRAGALFSKPSFLSFSRPKSLKIRF